MRLTVISLGMLLFSGCVHQFDLMKANAVSMKHYHLPANAKLVKVADVSSEYCPESFKSASGKDIGLIDEVVKEAEKKYGIDFIINPIFRSKGKCIIVEGEGFRIE